MGDEEDWPVHRGLRELLEVSSPKSHSMQGGRFTNIFWFMMGQPGAKHGQQIADNAATGGPSWKASLVHKEWQAG